MSWLETELREQPEALARLLERQADSARAAARLFRRSDIRYLLIASRGSSSNVARYAQYLLGRAHRVPVMFATPSLYTIYGQPPRLDGALVIGISQSGASPDVVAVLAEAREQGRPTLALTNDVDSPLARTADAVLPLEAGREQAVAATKTYVNSLGAVALLFAHLGTTRRRGRAGADAGCARRADRAFAVRHAAARGVSGSRRADGRRTRCQLRHRLRDRAQDPRALGLVTEAYSPADLMHGPIAAIQPGWPVVVVAPSGPARPSVEEVVPPLRARGARLMAVSDVHAVLRRAQTRLVLAPGVPEWLSPLTAVVPGQTAAMRLASLRGLDLDRPVGLRKVTLTR